MANNIILAPILLAQFVPWGVEHFLTVLIWALIGFVLIYWAQKLPKRQQHIIAIYRLAASRYHVVACSWQNYEPNLRIEN